MKRGSRKVLGRILIGLVVLLAAIQLFPVDRTNPPVESEIVTPPNVQAVLRRSCYDCHSNETAWPWYSRVAPVSWLLARDVHEGRRELNFSTWNRFPTQRRARKLKETWKEVSEGEMPPWYYLPLHREARLSEADREILRAWTLGASAASEDGREVMPAARMSAGSP